MRPRTVFRILAACGLLLALLPGSTLARNLGIEANSGDTITSTVSPPGDEDPIVFEAAAGSDLSASVKVAKGSLLEAGLKLVGPDGAELNVGAFLKQSSKGASLKKVVLPATGTYAVVVHGLNASSGGYQLKLKLKPPKGAKLKGQALAAGQTRDHVLGGVQDALLGVSIKIKSGDLEITDLLDPTGAAVTGFADSLKTKPGKSIKGKSFLQGPFGDFTLRIGNVTADAVYDISLSVKFPKVGKAKKEVPATEPRIDDVYASESGVPFGDPGTSVTLDGAGFSTFPRDPDVYFGDNPVAQFLLKRADKLVVRVPDGEGEVDVIVVNPDGNLDRVEKAFTYVGNPPSDLVLSDSRAGVNGGMVITVTGLSLDHVRKIVMGNWFIVLPPGGELTDQEKALYPSAAVSYSLETVVDGGGKVTAVNFTTVELPESRAGSLMLTVWDVFGQQSNPLPFELVAAPDVSALDPAGGSYLGGKAVTIHGPNAADWSEMYLDGSLLTTTWAPPDGQTFVTKPHAKGLVDLRVVDVFGQATTVPDAYEFNEGGWLDLSSTSIPKDELKSLKRGDALAVGDVDGDKDLDIVLGRDAPAVGERLLKLLLGDGKGKFTDGTFGNLPAPPIGDDAPEDPDENAFAYNAKALMLGDLDGDGDLDLVICSPRTFASDQGIYSIGTTRVIAANRPYPSARILLNDGTGKFTDVSEVALPNVRKQGADPLQGSTIALGDLDGDEDLDIVLSFYRQPGLTDKVVNYIGNSWYPSRYSFNVKYPPFTGVALATATRLLLNDGYGKFTNASSASLPKATDGDIFVGHHVLVADVDGDEDEDIVVTVESPDTRTGAKVEFVDPLKTGSRSKTRILANGGGRFTNVTQNLMPEAKTWDDWSGKAVAFGDLDGDKIGDLVIATDRKLYNRIPDFVYYTRTRVFTGQSSGGFVEATGKLPAVRTDGEGDMYEGQVILLEDIDGDGRLDVLLVTPSQLKGENPNTGNFDRTLSSTRILRNTGNAVLTDVTLRHLPNPIHGGDSFRAHAAWLGDLDGDDETDLVLTTSLPVLHPTRALFFR